MQWFFLEDCDSVGEWIENENGIFVEKEQEIIRDFSYNIIDR